MRGFELATRYLRVRRSHDIPINNVFGENELLMNAHYGVNDL